ncbi:MAG TPA: hypothetical protein VJ732_16325 [Bryobacteraceae bacterium]|nr:hypothetical protein [Bryobacteraceae bacterium]
MMTQNMKTKMGAILCVLAGVVLLLGYLWFTRSSPRSGSATSDGAPSPSRDPKPRGLTAPSVADNPPPNANAKIPDWVPIYPGATPRDISEQPAGYETSLGFNLYPKDGDCRVYMQFYRSKLTEGGFHVHNAGDTEGIAGTVGFCPSQLTAEGPGRTRTVIMSAGHRADGFMISINVTQRGHTGVANGAVAGTVKLPDWVPIYPGTAPEFMNELGGGIERRISYSFRSTDDAKKVISFFEQRLTSLGFHVNSGYTVSTGAYAHSTMAEGRVFNVQAAPPGAGPMFHVELVDRP